MGVLRDGRECVATAVPKASPRATCGIRPRVRLELSHLLEKLQKGLGATALDPLHEPIMPGLKLGSAHDCRCRGGGVSLGRSHAPFRAALLWDRAAHLDLRDAREAAILELGHLLFERVDLQQGKPNSNLTCDTPTV